jgi:hypothetical protein
MTITPATITKASGAAAIAAGTLFIGVQIGHPELNATSIQTTDVEIRDTVKVLMSALALAGLTGMYASQIRRNGLLGLLGYLVIAAAYLGIMCVSFVAAFVLPEIARSNPGYVSDVIAVNTGRGSVEGDIGNLNTFLQVQAFAYIGGGLLFGIALYRARVLARWACVLLAVGGLAAIVLSLMPDAFYRVLAFPNAVAMIGLGFSLWRTTRTSAETGPAAEAPASPVSVPRLQPPLAH